MQATASSLSDGFGLRRSMYSNAALSSEIVHSVFQREPDNDTFDAVGQTQSSREEDVDISRWGSEDMYSPENSHTYSPVKAQSQLTRITGRAVSRPSSELHVVTQDTPTPSLRPDVIKHLELMKRERALTTNLARENDDQAEAMQLVIKRRISVFRTQRRRELCRANQIRYRTRQRNHAKALEEAVQNLQREIPVLHLQRTRLVYGESNGIWGIVVEYFEKFRFGVQEFLPLESEEGQVDHPEEDPNKSESNRQLAFLRSSMSEDVALGKRSGVEALMDQWKQYSSSFQGLHFQLKRMHRVNDQFMSVSAVMKVTVSETTLQKVFPSVKSELLRSKLLGRRLQLPCSLWFEWDASSSRVTRVEVTVNIMTALLNVLGNVSDVASVLDHARISCGGAVGVSIEAVTRKTASS